MTVKAAATAWRLDVPPIDKLIALALAEGAVGPDDEVYHADVPHIAEMTGVHPDDIAEALVRLADVGALERVDLLTFRFVL